MAKWWTLLVLGGLGLLLSACAGLPEPAELEAPRYQPGGHAGAAFCATCHPDVYEQWKQHSRHALATRSSAFRDARNEILAHPVLGGFMTGKMCHSCHGDERRDAGIDCEACHGAVLKGVDIEVTHARVYTPGLKRMRGSAFCAACHQVDMPVTGEPLTTVHTEWKKSPAGRRGETCQTCHMPKPDGEYAHHGFATLVRNPALYRGKLALGGLKEDGGSLRVTLANRVNGHAIPAAGPTRVLALELVLVDAAGQVVHRETRRFFKHFVMAPLIGGVPFKLIDNSQLQAGERRRLRFELPAELRRQAREARLTLRMYEVADTYEGDLAHAHWQSPPLTVARLALAARE